MLKRIEESHQEDAFSGIESAQQYSETVKKSAGMMYRGFMKEIESLELRGRYLEVGSGPGILTTMVASKHPGVSITAVEVSPDMVEVARRYAESSHIEQEVRFVVGDASNAETIKELGKFNLVYSTFSLHHWEDPVRTIENLLEAVADNGVLLIHDLSRVWWLYILPAHGGFFDSIRAAYTPKEIREISRGLSKNQYKYKRVFPFFLQSLIFRK